MPGRNAATIFENMPQSKGRKTLGPEGYLVTLPHPHRPGASGQTDSKTLFQKVTWLRPPPEAARNLKLETRNCLPNPWSRGLLIYPPPPGRINWQLGTGNWQLRSGSWELV